MGLPELLAVGLSVLLTVALFPLIRRRAGALGLVDVPNKRSAHHKPVPRGGGLAIVLAVVAGCVVLVVMGTLSARELMMVTGAAVLVGGMGLADDRGDVSIRWRLVVHFTAALWVLYWLSSASLSFLEALAPYPLWAAVVIALVWGLNLYNFMDGIDGIALQETAFVALAGAALLSGTPSPWQAPLLILAMCSLAAVWWNWAPAKIFLGDVGSGFIGFLLATIAIDSAIDGTLPFATWVILWGVFLCDSGVTLLRRMLTGQRWYAAHSSHAYQHLARRFRSHAKVSGSIFILNVVWLLPWAWVSTLGVLSPIACVAASLGPLAVAAYLLGAGQPTRNKEG